MYPLTRLSWSLVRLDSASEGLSLDLSSRPTIFQRRDCPESHPFHPPTLSSLTIVVGKRERGFLGRIVSQSHLRFFDMQHTFDSPSPPAAVSSQNACDHGNSTCASLYPLGADGRSLCQLLRCKDSNLRSQRHLGHCQSRWTDGQEGRWCEWTVATACD